MDIKIFKCNIRDARFGVVSEDWLPGHVIFPIIKGAKYINVSDGKVGNMVVVYKETGLPVPAIEIVQKFLAQNRYINYVDQNGARTINYYDREFFIDYKPELKEFFEKNQLPIPADGKGVGERMLGSYVSTLKAFGLDEAKSEEIAPGQKAIQEAKEAAIEKELVATKSKKADKVS